MLRSIQELSSAVLALPQPAFTQKAQDTAERRQVTVMFSDLVGSTALSARMDPTCARSFLHIRSALPRLCSASAGS